MAILIDETKRVLVQGITGREGRARTRLMREYGTNVVAGVTPSKGGENVLGVPVFNSPQSNLSNPNFGVVTSTRNSPRQLQFGLKFMF